VFRAADLLKLINSGKLGKKKGTALLWDEAGVEQGSRTWQSQANRMINYLLQTFRHRCFNLLFTAPYADFVDSQTRKLFHAEFRTVKIEYSKRVVIVKPFQLQYNSRNRKWYYKYLPYKSMGTWAKARRWAIPAPPEPLIEAYEAKKNSFTKQLNKDIETSLKLKKGRTMLPLTEKEREVYQLGVQGLKGVAIAAKLGISSPMVHKYRNRILNKGYTLG
jgi:DNA-binding CsgD family transcriptional regulator